MSADKIDPSPPAPRELERVLEWTSGYEGQTQPVEVPPVVLSEAHRLLREMARDFDHFQEHQNDRYGACPRMDDPVSARCTCGLEEARERWRLSK